MASPTAAATATAVADNALTITTATAAPVGAGSNGGDKLTLDALLSRTNNKVLLRF
jgi:NAD(P)H-hydrate repair Nnr-like enzyme with NAD(P)H-hydrate epimerase domain